MEQAPENLQMAEDSFDRQRVKKRRRRSNPNPWYKTRRFRAILTRAARLLMVLALIAFGVMVLVSVVKLWQ